MSTDRLRIERKSFLKLSSSEREAWAGLLAASSTARWAFLSPTFAEAVNVTVGPVDVLLCLEGDVLAGVVPMQRAAGLPGWMGLREPVGREMSDYFGLLARPGFKTSWCELLRGTGIPCLYFTHLDESQAVCGLHGDSPTTGLRTLIPPEGGQALWESLRARDKKFVGNVERRERKLQAEHGPIAFEMASTTPVDDLAYLVELKNAQYRRTGKRQGALLNPANVRLLTLLLASRDPDCMPRLSTIRCGGRRLAAHFGLQCGSLLHYWFPAYDPAFSQFSPGQILYRKIVAAAVEHDIACIDRGVGDSDAKRSFANAEHLYCKGLVNDGAWGKALSLMQRAWWRLQ